MFLGGLLHMPCLFKVLKREYERGERVSGL